MKVFLWGLSVIFCAITGSLAQTIRVVDEDSQQAIADIFVYAQNKKVSGQTDAAGQVNFEGLLRTDTLYFQHPAYYRQWVAVEKLQKAGYEVALKENVVQLGETTVLMNRWEQNKNEVPHQIVSLKPGQINFANPQTAADALESTGQVFVQKSQQGGGSPMLRGFAANSVLIVVDGVRMNNAIFRGGNVQNVIRIDPAMIDKVEVVMGPGTVLYGSDALGGVMSFRTARSAYSTSSATGWSLNAFTRFASANTEKTTHADLSFHGQRWSTLTSFTYSDFGDLRAGSWRPRKYPDFGKRFHYVERAAGEDMLRISDNVNIQKASGYRQWNMMQKVRFRSSDLTELTYGFIYSTTSDIYRYDRLILYDEVTGLPENAVWYYGPQRWMMQYLKAGFFKANPLFDQMKITLASQLMQESRNDRKFQNNFLRNRTEKVNAYTLNADADKALGAGHRLFYGLELLHNDVLSQAQKKNIVTGELTASSTRYPDGGSGYSSAAAYVNHQWSIRPDISLTTGLRYSRVRLYSLFKDTTFYKFSVDHLVVNTGAFSGSSGLVYRPDNSWKLSAMLSTGFRAPNVDDIGKVFDSEPGNIVVPNASLKPEYTYNAEIGISKLVADKLQLEGAVYCSRLRNAMVRRNFTFNEKDSVLYDGELSRVQALVNAGKAYIWGFSLNATATVNPFWNFHSLLSYNTGRDTEEDAPLQHTSPWFGRTSASYHHHRWKGEFYVKYNGPRAYNDLPPSEKNDIYLYTPQGTLAWFTLNMMAAYQINGYLQAQAGVENILDKHYRPYASGISASGRNFVFALRGSL